MIRFAIKKVRRILADFKAKMRKTYFRFTGSYRQKKLKNTDFTIISNNCWGGSIYESYGLIKQSPTVGMYFMADEYLRFVSNLQYYLCQCDIEFISPEEARYLDFYSGNLPVKYPIARLGDVEIAMMHFHSEEEARAKWERRCKRINWDRLLVKMNDQNGCTAEQAKAFGALPYANKVFFTVKDLDAGDCTVRIPAKKDAKSITFSQEPWGASKYCNINELINQL